jgi:hypothetical protein
VNVLSYDLDYTADPAEESFIGSNPSAVGWDGCDLFVAGFNSSGGTADVGIVKIQNLCNNPDGLDAFGLLSTPNLRGYSGLDIGDMGLAAAYDDGGSDPNGIALHNAPGSSTPPPPLWTRTARGGSGVGIDPGFPGGSAAPEGLGVGWTTFGSGRRALQNGVTGADIYTTADGMIILTSEGTFWRDMDFDDDTGDVWLREGNNVIHWERTGDNAVANGTVVFDPVDSDFVNGQNIAFCNRPDCDVVIFNDRSSTSSGQSFFDVVRVIQPDGTPLAVDWGSFSPATGVGYYDFSWDPHSDTLAILDFANRNVHIFEIQGAIGGPFTCQAATNSTGVGGGITALGSASVSDNNVSLCTSDLPANAFGFFITSRSSGFAANPGGSQGNLCLSGSIGRYVGPGQIQNSGSGGSFSLQLDLTTMPSPTGLIAAQPGETWYFQAWHRDSVQGVAVSNFTGGVSVTFN